MRELNPGEALKVGDKIIEPTGSGENYVSTVYKIGAKLVSCLDIKGKRRLYPNTYEQFFRWRTGNAARAFRGGKTSD